jgi:hypothetical protein
MEHSPEPKESISRFAKLLVGLAQAEVDYAIVGGLAVVFNGFDRLTLDADILVHASSENLQKLLDYLSRWGEGWARELRPDDFTLAEGSIRVTEDFDLDIFTQMRGRTLDFFRPRLKKLQLGETVVRYLAPQDLVLLKEDSWREKDRLDAAAMKEAMARDSGRV